MLEFNKVYNPWKAWEEIYFFAQMAPLQSHEVPKDSLSLSTVRFFVVYIS